tara:strand:- start:1607 stop:1759 length:153 start_codon:yes stop_codon:yes gene_type:complete
MKDVSSVVLISAKRPDFLGSGVSSNHKLESSSSTVFSLVQKYHFFTLLLS